VLHTLSAIVGDSRVTADAPLAALTTFGVGGPADWLVEVRSVEELRQVVHAAAAAGQPVHVLGGGSNVLISDRGVRGVVLRLRLTGVTQPSADRVRAEAGLTMNGLVRWMIGRGLAGLEAWAGTPGTIGGAIHGNAHYGGEDISGHVITVAVVTPQGEWREEPASAMGFGYDTSRLFETREIVVWADMKAAPGEPDALRAVARASLAHRKRTQPLHLPSAGCVFQNPQPGRDVVPDVGRCACGSGRLEGRGAGRRDGVAHPRQLHRGRSHRVGG